MNKLTTPNYGEIDELKSVRGTYGGKSAPRHHDNPRRPTVHQDVSHQEVMDIFDFLKSPQYVDPALGSLSRKGGYWRGQIRLEPDGEVPLLLAGSRRAPDNANLELARALIPKYSALRPAIEGALFEHYEPYAEGVASGSAEVLEGIPKLNGSDQVWNHVSLVRVLIEPLGRTETVEIAYRTGWDVEHTVGARFQNWVLVELNGSVI